MKRRASERAQGLYASGVWPALQDPDERGAGVVAAATSPAKPGAGVLASRSPASTSTGTAGSGASGGSGRPCGRVVGPFETPVRRLELTHAASLRGRTGRSGARRSLPAPVRTPRGALRAGRRRRRRAGSRRQAPAKIAPSVALPAPSGPARPLASISAWVSTRRLQRREIAVQQPCPSDQREGHHEPPQWREIAAPGAAHGGRAAGSGRACPRRPRARTPARRHRAAGGSADPRADAVKDTGARRKRAATRATSRRTAGPEQEPVRAHIRRIARRAAASLSRPNGS